MARRRYLRSGPCLPKFATFHNNVVVDAAFCVDWKSRDSLSRQRVSERVKRSVIKPLFCRVNHYHTDQAKHRRAAARHKPSIRIVARREGNT